MMSPAGSPAPSGIPFSRCTQSPCLQYASGGGLQVILGSSHSPFLYCSERRPTDDAVFALIARAHPGQELWEQSASALQCWAALIWSNPSARSLSHSFCSILFEHPRNEANATTTTAPKPIPRVNTVSLQFVPVGLRFAVGVLNPNHQS